MVGRMTVTFFLCAQKCCRLLVRRPLTIIQRNRSWIVKVPYEHKYTPHAAPSQSFRVAMYKIKSRRFARAYFVVAVALATAIALVVLELDVRQPWASGKPIYVHFAVDQEGGGGNVGLNAKERAAARLEGRAQRAYAVRRNI